MKHGLDIGHGGHRCIIEFDKGAEHLSFYSNLEQYGECIALIDDKKQKITYGGLAQKADNLARLFEGKRNLVFIFCSNTIPSIVAYLACLRNGHIPLLVDEKINQELSDHLVSLYRPNYLIMPSAKAPKRSIYDYEGYCIIKENEERISLYEKLALLLPTSGSTGSPKLVRQSGENIDSNAESICQYLHITHSERPITTLPMNYTYGLSIINSHLKAGATILLTDRSLMEKDFWMFLREQEATTFGGVPYTYEMLKRLRFLRMDLPSLKYLTQAGGKLNYELTKEFVEGCAQKGIEFIVMYGQTEATARMSYLPAEQAIAKCGSIGIAIPGGGFSLQDDDGEEITQAEVPGELVYRGKNVTLGYAESIGDLAKGDERNGVLTTGDIAKRDADGYYYIVGRKKRFIKVFGNRVNLDEVEQILKNKGFFCACTGQDDKLMVATPDQRSVEEIMKILPRMLGLNRSAFTVKYVAEIPKNEAGKVIYAKLFEEFS